MFFLENGLKATVMSTVLMIEANVSKKVLYESLDIAKEFEAKYSAYREDSLLSQINKFSGVKAIECSAEELEIFKKSLEIAKISNGLFDPTMGALTQGLYGFGTDHEKIPSTKELQKYKKLVDYKALEISDSDIFLAKKGMRLDLGGIGKGYVSDKIMEHLIKRGATKAIVSVGGEICSFGKEYNIAIKNPFSDGNFGVIKTSKELVSISTSGDYERYIVSKDNHHILDNQSAKSNHYYSSLTVIKNSLEATLLDGVATIAFNSKRNDLKNIAKKFEVAIIAITPLQEIYFENFSNLNIKSFESFPFI
jgi:thiamine biosynthesis lipoprotein